MTLEKGGAMLTLEQNAFLAEKLGWKWRQMWWIKGEKIRVLEPPEWDGNPLADMTETPRLDISALPDLSTPDGMMMILEGMREVDEGVRLIFCQLLDAEVMSATAQKTPPFASNWRAFIMLYISPELVAHAALKAWG